MKNRTIPIVLLLLILGALVNPVHAQGGIQVNDSQAILTFPESILFQASIQAGTEIRSVTLQYGADQLTCGTVVAQAFPVFDPASSVEVEWTWEMRQSGSMPPGATIWWQWVVKDADNNEFTSPRQEMTWLDDFHDWQEITGGNINLHYYEGGEDFGETLHTAAAEALVNLAEDTGIQAEKPVNIYIYGNNDDFQDAILYEPGWSGGIAYPEHNIVIIGISPANLEWGKRTEAHELTHVLVGHQTFSCLGFVPTWLNEGLAMYGEGGPETSEQTRFDQAVAEDELMSLRSLSGNFSEEADRANLSYTESYSVVNYLIATYGREKMTALLLQLKNGATADIALETTYGFDVDGLEDEWRQAIGAAPRAGGVLATPAFTPTVVPTIVPVAGIPAVPSSPTPRPTQALAATRTAEPSTQVAASPVPQATTTRQPIIPKDTIKYLGVGFACCLVVILAVGIPVLLSLRRRRTRRTP